MKQYNRCLFYCYKDLTINTISFLIILIIISLLFVSCFIKFDFCYRYSGLVMKEDDYYVSILVDNDWFNLQNVSLVVDGCKLDYSVISISSDYTITDNSIKREVKLKFDIDDNKKIVNNVLNLYFVRRMTFLSKVREMIF